MGPIAVVRTGGASRYVTKIPENDIYRFGFGGDDVVGGFHRHEKNLFWGVSFTAKRNNRSVREAWSHPAPDLGGTVVTEPMLI